MALLAVVLHIFAALSAPHPSSVRKSLSARTAPHPASVLSAPPRSGSVRSDRFAAREPMSKDEAGHSTSLAATLSELVVTRAQLAVLRTQKATSDAIDECQAAIGRAMGRGG